MPSLCTWAPLQALEKRTEIALAAGTPVAIRTGERSGKSTLLLSLAQDRRKIFIIGRSTEHVERIYEWYLNFYKISKTFVTFLGCGTASPRKLENLGALDPDPRTIILLDEPWRWDRSTNSEKFFEVVAQDQPRLVAIGSRGEQEWNNLKPVWRFNTWDLCPNIKREDLKDEYRINRKKAEQKYEG